ncbi:hypothetical protein [Thiothrix sp.]|jgi:phosphohistidine phosphatase SixA|uniref:hypothetical protein n=1 Tax=Thiothrix sp. TaxID=1032 RepID=UPI00257BC1E1|nr:hypothetical protein [Thiothrix sp.]
MKIILMRHGKPDFDFSRRVKATEFARIAHEYDTAGMVDHPPIQAMEQAQQCNAVVVSDLIRSHLSAQALILENIVLSSTLFKEAPLPYPSSGNIKLSVSIWAVLLRVAWLLGYSQNSESFNAASNRAKEAAGVLMQLAEKHGSVLLVGHGVMNWLLAKELRKQGWAGKTTSQGGKHWGFGVYEYTT